MSRKRGPVETPEYGQMVRRMIRSYAKRVADADPEDLTELLQLEEVLRDAIQLAVDGQREQYGRSWADIARAAGITRSAAFQRWGKDDRVAGYCLDCKQPAKRPGPDAPFVIRHADGCPNDPGQARITMQVGHLLGMSQGHRL